ncbi:hypothetical protein AB0J80_24315 [Actinoplanes sp. NPDC049548]|uniref:hypothetical protein n=1 Tax=Actinoplanes sp. NPDC049548 TaxID=3155152 RepID=UPI00343F8789
MSATWEESHVARTDAGMCALWQPEHFTAVTDLDSWENEVAEDDRLVAHMRDGAFVPLNVGGDGSWQVVVRRGGLTARESRYRLVSSEPYLLVSRGAVALGGLEDVGDDPPTMLPLEAGRYAVTVHLIEWDAEPGALGPEGNPTERALSDFVVEVGAAGDGPYRTRVETFDRP